MTDDRFAGARASSACPEPRAFGAGIFRLGEGVRWAYGSAPRPPSPRGVPLSPDRPPLDRRLVTILLIVFVQMLGASMALPILPLYAKNEFAMSPRTITVLIASFFAAQFLAGPFIGRLSDKRGRVPVLVVSQIGTALSFVMLGAAGSVAMLFASRILDGITGGNIIVAQAYITDITPREKRTQALGYIFAAFGLGFIFGPALGGVLAANIGPRAPFYLAAIAATVTVVLTGLTLDESLSDEARATNRGARRGGLGPRAVLGNLPLLLVLLIALVGQFGLGLLQATFALFGEAVLFPESPERALMGIGLILSAIGLTQLITQVLILRRLVPRLGEARVALVGILIRGLAMLILAALTTPAWALLGGVLFALGMGLMMPSLQSLTTATVTDDLRGGVLGLYQSAVSLSTILSMLVAGSIFLVGPTIPYWLGSALTFAIVLPALLLLRRTPGTESDHAAEPGTTS